jgi:hypothetical protein
MSPETTYAAPARTAFNSMLLDSSPIQASSSLPEVPMSPSFGLGRISEIIEETLACTSFEGMLLDGGADQAYTSPAERSGILGPPEESATISQLDLSGGYNLATSAASGWNVPFTVSKAQSALSAPLEVTDSLEPFSVFGAHPEIIIPQLQHMESMLSKLQDSRDRDFHLHGSVLSKNQLKGEIMSGWLLSEVKDILCWSYLVSAKRTRQQKAGAEYKRGGNRKNSLPMYRDGGRISDADADDVWRGRPASQLRGKLSGLLTAERGSFRVELREASKKSTENHGRRPPYSIILHFVPDICGFGPKVGISVAFSSLPGINPHPRVCPTITTFNVVLKNSEIITCVEENDLIGVRRLLDECKASTTDVDPDGYSLLWVSQSALWEEVIWTDRDDSMPCSQDVRRYSVYFYRVEQVHSVATGANYQLLINNDSLKTD